MNQAVTKQETQVPAMGLEKLNEKMDVVLNAASEAKTVADELKVVAQEAKQCAENAKAMAEEAKTMADEAKKDAEEATKKANTADVSFGDDMTMSKKNKSAEIKAFLDKVKSAKYTGNKAALQAGSASGSYIVPPDFVPELLNLLSKYPSFINQCRYLPWGAAGTTRKIPNLGAYPTAAVVGEGASKGVSNPTFTEVTQTLVKSAAIVLLTQELAEDNAIDLEKLLPEIVAPSFVNFYNAWLFQGITGHAGIFNASGILTPTVSGIADLLELKLAVPYQYRATGKFYLETSVYGTVAKLAKSSAYSWLYYEDGKMKIDGSEVVPLDYSIIGGTGRCVFGDLGSVIFSPKKEFEVRFSDQATIVDGNDTHNLFQQNKEAFLFESRADISVTGSVWAKCTISANNSQQ